MRTIMSKDAYKSIEKLTKSKRQAYKFLGGDFNAELGPGVGFERLSVGPYTLKESNKRGHWMKQWLMMQKFLALNTMYKKDTWQTNLRTEL